ncbi:alpha/beta hydrolase [Microbacterium sp. P01]|uniref:alpha/beta hydrolase n=1 Tax=unclassified Microbacterium TaxID=2609290 RepID=UPI00366E5A2D
MTAALLMTHPTLLAGAILLRPTAPFASIPDVRIPGSPVMIVDGAADDRRTPADGVLLADQLRQLGAMVTHHVIDTGHGHTDVDRQLARRWLGSTTFRSPD